MQASNSTVQNAAFGGTTAAQWKVAGADAIDGCLNVNYDVVYMSYGGNDLLESGCTMSSADLAEEIRLAIENTRTTIYPGATSYVLAGYCQVKANSECAGGASSFTALNDALTSLASTYAADANVKILNHMTVCGGTLSSYVVFSNTKHTASSQTLTYLNNTQIL